MRQNITAIKYNKICREGDSIVACRRISRIKKALACPIKNYKSLMKAIRMITLYSESPANCLPFQDQTSSSAGI